MYLAVAVVGNGSKLLDATKGLLLYMIRTHAESHELVRDIIGTILTEPLVEVGCACGTVGSTDDTDRSFSLERNSLLAIRPLLFLHVSTLKK